MNQEPVPKIQSPSGIDLHPDPPPAVRLSKRAGILALVVVGVVVAMIGYGIIVRKQRAVEMVKLDDKKNLTAATEAGKSVASQVPERSITEKREEPETDEEEDDEELQPPSPGGTAQQAQTALAPRSAPAHVAPPTTVYREQSPEEKRHALLVQQQIDALSAPTSIRNGGASPSSAPASTRESDIAQMTALLQAFQGQKPATSVGSGATAALAGFASRSDSGEGQNYGDQSMQDEKAAFLNRARTSSGDNYLKSTRTAPVGRYEIKAGWDIPAVLEQSLNSDLPGEVRALVRENVYDTATGQHLLIPQGARLVGVYDSRISYGQDGMTVIWNRIIYPDGSSVNLEGMAGQDAHGQSGLRDKVDNHYKRLIGFVALTSGFSAAFQLSQSRRGTILGYPSAGEVAGSAVGREISQLGDQVTRRNLNVQPTIKVPIGYRFNVRVNRDLHFESMYEPRYEAGTQ